MGYQRGIPPALRAHSARVIWALLCGDHTRYGDTTSGLCDVCEQDVHVGSGSRGFCWVAMVHPPIVAFAIRDTQRSAVANMAESTVRRVSDCISVTTLLLKQGSIALTVRLGILRHSKTVSIRYCKARWEG